jgi:hypothetical protein
MEVRASPGDQETLKISPAVFLFLAVHFKLFSVYITQHSSRAAKSHYLYLIDVHSIRIQI